VSAVDAHSNRGSVSFSWSIAGPPRISRASLTELATDRLQLSFVLRSGRNAAPLKSVTVSAPAGLRFRPSRRGVAVTAGGRRIRHAVGLKHGRLVIATAEPQRSIRVTIADPALKPSGSGVRRTLRVTPTDAAGNTTTLTTHLRF
jgi:hypothetical protein